MYNKIYERKEFMIFQVREGYIVYNAKKSFQEGHTHLKHFEAAKTAIDLVIRKKIPKSTHGYYLTSLIRLSEDDCYINKIKELMESRAQKGKKEINSALAERTYYAGRYAYLCCSGYSTSRLYGMWTGEFNTGWGS